MTNIKAAHLTEFRKQLGTVKSLPSEPTDKKGIAPNADRSIKSYPKHATRLESQGDTGVLHNRESLRCLVKSATDRNIEHVCAAILAWGGMTAPSFNALFGSPDKEEWLDVALSIKAGGLSRSDAFSKFRNLRAQDGSEKASSKLPGMGPAYFTKLIHFLTPDEPNRPTAHILDQWAGWSVNALWDSPIVLMDETFSWSRDKKTCSPKLTPSLRVSDTNTGVEYERFCTKVDDLIVRLGDEAKSEFLCSSDLIDRTFMFEQRAKAETWRNYLVNNHKQPRFQT